jgi:pimeloyl-ACP methyl ester carboxylesterase
VANSIIESLDLKIGERKAHYLKAGSGSPVVLLHGAADDSKTWAETIVALSHSYSLYAPDVVGYGLSEKDKDSYYLSEFVEFIWGFIESLGLDSMALVGHSLGGRICLEIALQHPERVRRLVLIDAIGFGKLARWGLFLGAAAWAIRKALGRPQPYPLFLREKGEDKDLRRIFGINTDRLEKLNVPTLLIWNRLDPYNPVRNAINAKRLMPEARLEIFPGYGHAPHVRNRDYFNNLLLNYLDHDQSWKPQKQVPTS